MTLLEGRLRVLIGRGRCPRHVPGPREHGPSPAHVGATRALLCITYPSVNVGTYFVDGIEYQSGIAEERARGSGELHGHEAKRSLARLPGWGAGPDASSSLAQTFLTFEA